jgi:hypothetical protein
MFFYILVLTFSAAIIAYQFGYSHGRNRGYSKYMEYQRDKLRSNKKVQPLKVVK